jgi:small nuclear ribonucleoprotein (snRNP)-like protein
MYLNNRVKIKIKNGDTIEGKVISYSSALQNVEEFGLEQQNSIEIQQDGYIEFLYESDISKIELDISQPLQDKTEIIAV